MPFCPKKERLEKFFEKVLEKVLTMPLKGTIMRLKQSSTPKRVTGGYIMNTYEITFQRENGTTGTDRFVASTEAQARRDFKEVYRHGNGTITSVELVVENTPATKEQERKALEQIKKIVESLGKDSYIATAFEGCFDLAEENIENDWACSMKQRVEAAEKKVEEAEKQTAALEKKLKLKELDERDIRDALEREKENHSRSVSSLRQRTLNIEDTDAVIALVLERVAALSNEVKETAERIVSAAEETESAAFKNAVSDHRSAKRAKEKYDALLERLARLKD